MLNKGVRGAKNPHHLNQVTYCQIRGLQTPSTRIINIY